MAQLGDRRRRPGPAGRPLPARRRRRAHRRADRQRHRACRGAAARAHRRRTARRHLDRAGPPLPGAGADHRHRHGGRPADVEAYQALRRARRAAAARRPVPHRRRRPCSAELVRPRPGARPRGAAAGARRQALRRRRPGEPRRRPARALQRRSRQPRACSPPPAPIWRTSPAALSPAGFQVGIHAIGDRGGLVALDALERALGGPAAGGAASASSTPRSCASTDLERLARLGDHRLDAADPRHLRHALGAGDRLGERPPGRRLRLAQGAGRRRPAGPGERLSRSSRPTRGSASTPPSPARTSPAGPAGGWLPGERLTREEALRGFTLDAAWSLFLGPRGGLARGRQARRPGGLRPRPDDGARGRDPRARRSTSPWSTAGWPTSAAGSADSGGRRRREALGRVSRWCLPASGVRSRALGFLAVALSSSPARAGLRPSPTPSPTQRRAMVEEQIRQRGITQPAVLAAMGQVPRHLFVPPAAAGAAYDDQALPLAPGGSIYQPYVVALMTSLLDLKPGDRVLEVGTGSGYHAAVLSRMAREVYSIEINGRVAAQARSGSPRSATTTSTSWSATATRGGPTQGAVRRHPALGRAAAVPSRCSTSSRWAARWWCRWAAFFQDLHGDHQDRATASRSATIIPVRLSPHGRARCAMDVDVAARPGRAGAGRRPAWPCSSLSSAMAGARRWLRRGAGGPIPSAAAPPHGGGADPRPRRRRAATCCAAMDEVPRHLFVPAARARPGLRGPAAAHRPRPDHLPALHRGADDLPAGRSRPAAEGAGDRHRLGLPGGGARRGWRARSTPSRSSTPLGRPGAPAPSPSWATATSTSASATATRAGPRRRPFDAIVLTAAPPRIPAALLEQLKPGGRMVLPVGTLLAGPDGRHQARRRRHRDTQGDCPCASCR